jgi:hypothetical protein
MKLDDLAGEEFGVFTGDEGEYLVLIRVATHHVQRAHANRAGGAKDG